MGVPKTPRRLTELELGDILSVEELDSIPAEIRLAISESIKSSDGYGEGGGNITTGQSYKPIDYDDFPIGMYMINKTGTETVSLTEQTKGVGSYQWSPEGKYISFLTAGKEEKEGSQLFLLDRRGGEPIQLTHIKGEIAAYQWFKDGSKILFEIKDPSFADTAKSKVRQPYEIDRYHFKADYEGYLDNRKTHL